MSASADFLLAVDTSGPRAGVVLAGDGRRETGVLALRPGGFARTEDLAAVTAGLLEGWGLSASDLTLLGAVVGPGSYTGLRSGLAFVRGMAFPRGLSALGAGTLELLAWQGAAEGERVGVLVPAGSAGFALSIYERGRDLAEASGDPQLVSMEALTAAIAGLAGDVAAVVVADAKAADSPGQSAGIAAEGTAIAEAARAAGLDLRVVAGDGLVALADLLLAKRSRQGVSNVDTLLPVYVGETRARPNRDRVALAARPE